MARGPASATAVHVPLGHRRFRLANALGGSGLGSGGSLAAYALLLLKPHRGAVGEVDRRREAKEGGGGVSCGAHNTPPRNFPTNRGTNGPAHMSELKCVHECGSTCKRKKERKGVVTTPNMKMVKRKTDSYELLPDHRLL